jgi:hypothetical protein
MLEGCAVIRFEVFTPCRANVKVTDVSGKTDFRLFGVSEFNLQYIGISPGYFVPGSRLAETPAPHGKCYLPRVGIRGLIFYSQPRHDLAFSSGGICFFWGLLSGWAPIPISAEELTTDEH